ncbi:MAG: hypothetical protein ABJC13_24520 [Acidobacteriota bacterium]
MTTEETPGGLPNRPPIDLQDPPQNIPPSDPAVHPPGILPPLPERRAWPWALLLAIAHQAATGLGFAALNSNQEVLNLFFFLMVGLVPLAFILGLVLIARKRSFPGRVLMFGALYSVALVALELAVAAGVCIFAFSKPGSFH